MLSILLLLPFLGAALCAILASSGLPKRTPWVITMATTLAGLAVLASLTGFPPKPQETAVFIPWVPEIGLNFSIWLDGPAVFFAWLVLGLGALIFFYAGFYMDPDDSPWRFFGTMLFFMGSMLGVVLSKNALLMFVFWELTSISSFILIGHWHEKASARQGAVRALVVTAGGGLCLLAGLALLLMRATALGIDPATALEWDVLWQHRELLSGEYAVMILLLLGAFTKSAQFPFHFWLPGAMEAPTPVSAFLHAATMVKAGIYLLGRMYPVFSDNDWWLAIVGTAGVLTMLVGGFMAIMSRDLKQLLAHSTVSQLGLLTAYYGFGAGLVGTDSPLKMDLLLIASHAFFKGALFMLVGVIDHGAHTRDWTKLGGLIKSMPVTAVLVIAGCASMAGLPFTFGFIAKELFLHHSLHLHTENALLKFGLPALGVIASFFTAAYCYRTAISPFFGKPRDEHIHAHEGSFGLLISPAILILICVAGLWVPLLEGPIAPLINGDFYKTKTGFTLAFFHHVDILLGLAVLIFSAGAVVFAFSQRIEKAYTGAGSPAAFRGSFDVLFDQWIPKFAKATVHAVQSHSLAWNVTLALAFIFGIVAYALTVTDARPLVTLLTVELKILTVAVLIMMVASLYVVLTHPVLLYRLVAMSPIGLFVALMFLLYKAPDLALTQLLVEVVTLLVFLLLLWRIPQRTPRQNTPLPMTLLRAATAVCVGISFGVISLLAYSSPWRDQPTLEGWPSTADYYLENTKYPLNAKSKEEGLAKAEAAPAYPVGDPVRSGGGYNSVNVILVDFRGIDTMGEIMVLGLAGMGVFLMMTYHRKRPKPDVVRQSREAVARLQGTKEKPLLPEAPILKHPMWAGPSLILAQTMRLVPPALLAFAAVLYWVGHNEPGGGFIAGLMVSVGLACYFLSFVPKRVSMLHTERYLMLIPVGMILAIATGLAAVAAGRPFFTSAFVYLDWGWFGTLGLASPAVFDLGVFAVVVGMAMLIIEKFRKD